MNTFDWHVLRAVRALEPYAYGVPIRQSVEEFRGRNTSTGSVHVALDRMLEAGHLTAVMSDATEEKDGRRKRYYHLTASGRDAVERPSIETPSFWTRVTAPFRRYRHGRVLCVDPFRRIATCLRCHNEFPFETEKPIFCPHCDVGEGE